MGTRTPSPPASPSRMTLGYRPNVNQMREELIPASHDGDLRQEAVRQNELKTSR